MTTSPIIVVLAGIGTVIVAGLLFAWLVRENRQPDGPERIVALILALMVIESALYQNQNDVPTGLFHLQVGSLSFRLFDVLVPLALAARLVARPPARRTPIQVLVWSSFLLWIFGAGLVGLMLGNPKDFVSYEAKAIIYLGMFVLVAAVPPHRWLVSRALRVTVLMSSAVAALLILTSEAGLSVNVNLPVVPLSSFGPMGPDAATIFATLGIVTLAVALYSDRRRLATVVVSLPLLAAPLVSAQRAALVGLGVSILIVLAAIPVGRRRVRLTGSELAALCLAAVAGVTVLVVVTAMRSRPVTVPLAHQLQDTFTSESKQLSASDRVNQWAQARALIAARPWFGWGLGKTYEYYSPGLFGFVDTDITHNIALDLLVRSGVIGLLLFLLAAVLSVRDSVLSWLHEADDRVAALIVAGMAAFVGLIAKGMFESLFEKYRLALLMGGLVGLSMTFAAATLEARAAEWRMRTFRAETAAGVVP